MPTVCATHPHISTWQDAATISIAPAPPAPMLVVLRAPVRGARAMVPPARLASGLDRLLTTAPACAASLRRIYASAPSAAPTAKRFGGDVDASPSACPRSALPTTTRVQLHASVRAPRAPSVVSPAQQWRCRGRLVLGPERVSALWARRLLHPPWSCALAARWLTTRCFTLGLARRLRSSPAHRHMMERHTQLPQPWRPSPDGRTSPGLVG